MIVLPKPSSYFELNTVLKLCDHNFLKRVVGQSRPFYLLLSDPRPPKVLNLTLHIRGVRLGFILQGLRAQVLHRFIFALALARDVLLNSVKLVVNPLK